MLVWDYMPFRQWMKKRERIDSQIKLKKHDAIRKQKVTKAAEEHLKTVCQFFFMAVIGDHTEYWTDTNILKNNMKYHEY